MGKKNIMLLLHKEPMAGACDSTNKTVYFLFSFIAMSFLSTGI